MTNLQPSESTDIIRVAAAAEFMPQEVLPQEFSDPSGSDESAAVERCVFRYKGTMTNVGHESASLLTRHWIIVDGEGKREEVRGRGVVGEYPSLAPGESYSYISYCPLPTKWGTMEGSYTFAREDGSQIVAAIPRFFLVPTAPPLELEQPSV